MERRNISLEELKQIELETLKEIHKICVAEGIKYSLSGGTLIGAVRHGGFIPWDDDIDILMPRPEYNRFIEYCKNNKTDFRLICSETDSKYGYLFAKAVNPNTVIIEEGGNRDGADLGVYVDIFPIDGLADDREKAKVKFNEKRFRRELLVAYNWRKYFRSKTKSIIYEPIRFGFFVLSRFANSKKLIEKIQKQFLEENFEKYKYAGCICGAYRSREILPREVYAETSEIEFEGNTFMAMTNKDAYLTTLYGDYMKLPPEDKQVSHHAFTAYWKE